MDSYNYNKTCIYCGKTFAIKEETPIDICGNCKYDVPQMYKCEVLGQPIILQNEYFKIIREDLANRKTPIYHIETLDGVSLGEIKWYGAWRKFCFFPNVDTIWDNKCLTFIIKFLDESNKKWRENSVHKK